MLDLSRISSTSFAGRIMRLPLRAIPAGSRVPILQGPLRGKRWIAGSSDHGCWLGTYERGKQKAFADAVRPGDVVFDLGANAGWYSLFASVLGASRVYSFEPVPANAAVIREHMRLNAIANCEVFEVAVGRNEHTAAFDLGFSNSSGHLTESEFAHDASARPGITVRTVTLDGIIDAEGLAPPDVIKCDIEGAELEALRGARHTLRQYGPTILLATHTTSLHKQCGDFLRDLGYSISPVPGTRFEDEMMARRPSRTR